MKSAVEHSIAWLVGELRAFTVRGRKRDVLIEDGRQVAKAVIIAGFLGIMTGQISLLSAVVMVVLGIGVWLLVARLTTNDGDQHGAAI